MATGTAKNGKRLVGPVQPQKKFYHHCIYTHNKPANTTISIAPQTLKKKNIVSFQSSPKDLVNPFSSDCDAVYFDDKLFFLLQQCDAFFADCQVIPGYTITALHSLCISGLSAHANSSFIHCKTEVLRNIDDDAKIFSVGSMSPWRKMNSLSEF